MKLPIVRDHLMDYWNHCVPYPLWEKLIDKGIPLSTFSIFTVNTGAQVEPVRSRKTSLVNRCTNEWKRPPWHWQFSVANPFNPRTLKNSLYIFAIINVYPPKMLYLWTSSKNSLGSHKPFAIDFQLIPRIYRIFKMYFKIDLPIISSTLLNQNVIWMTHSSPGICHSSNKCTNLHAR